MKQWYQILSNAFLMVAHHIIFALKGCLRATLNPEDTSECIEFKLSSFFNIDHAVHTIDWQKEKGIVWSAWRHAERGVIDESRIRA